MSGNLFHCEISCTCHLIFVFFKWDSDIRTIQEKSQVCRMFFKSPDQYSLMWASNVLNPQCIKIKWIKKSNLFISNYIVVDL
jgi:hypothetical protein